MFQTIMGLGITAMLLIILLPVLAFVFWVWMIVDCVSRKFKDKTDKIVWVLVIMFAHIIGASIYYVLVKRKD